MNKSVKTFLILSSIILTCNISAVLAGGTPAISIDASGNVGIGTNSPSAKLDVNGSVKVQGSDFQLGSVYWITNF